jgi:hypothetical protein
MLWHAAAPASWASRWWRCCRSHLSRLKPRADCLLLSFLSSAHCRCSCRAHKICPRHSTLRQLRLPASPPRPVTFSWPDHLTSSGPAPPHGVFSFRADCSATATVLTMASLPHCISAHTVWACKLTVSSYCCCPPPIRFYRVGAAKPLSRRQADRHRAAMAVVMLRPSPFLFIVTVVTFVGQRGARQGGSCQSQPRYRWGCAAPATGAAVIAGLGRIAQARPIFAFCGY